MVTTKVHSIHSREARKIDQLFHCFRQILALGFYHMQSAYDRDDYVSIKWENMISGAEKNFRKYSPETITHFNGSYDYDSIMHYSAYGFSKNHKPTIVPLVSVLARHQST